MAIAANSQRRHVVLLVLLATGMFGFAFALVPLYDIFCELTGLNGKTGAQVAVVEVPPVVVDRDVKIQFLAHVGNGMPWEFRPQQSQITVQPGEMHTVTFYARNRAQQGVTGQAVPSVTPGIAAAHLHKVECFCFEQQHLDAGEALEMPVTFYVDAELPEDISTISLAYTLFRVADVQPETVADTRLGGL
jgi:cytochrome c oxidase assembly protein subunit 11